MIHYEVFFHDSNALQDEKITELVMLHGYEGMGLFYAILEKLAAQEKPIKTAVLKKQLGVGKKLEKAWSGMEEIGLISSKNGETFNLRMKSYVETYEKKREGTKKRVSQYRENQEVPENVTRSERDGNTTEENRREENNNTHDANASSVPDLFEMFWELYDKKTDRKKCIIKFGKLSLSDQKAILENVPEYVKLHPNPNYRKNPLTYLNGEVWKDPLVSSNRPPEKEMVY